MHNAVRNASNKYSKHRQNENEANDITWSQIFDAKQQCWKNVTQLTRWPCSIMNSRYRLRMQKNVCNGQRFASFYCCLAFARFWKVKFWRSFIKCKYFNDGWTDFHQKYISLSWAFFENRKNSGFTPGQNGDPDVKDDPVTQWPSSMSGPHNQ